MLSVSDRIHWETKLQIGRYGSNQIDHSTKVKITGEMWLILKLRNNINLNSTPAAIVSCAIASFLTF